jgi:omega-6 fatty acid desaturase (delta-12 desaturase)
MSLLDILCSSQFNFIRGKLSLSQVIIEYMVPTPTNIDSLTRESDIKLKELRSVIPKGAFRLSPTRAISALLVRLAIIAGALWGLTVAPSYLYPLLWFIQGWTMVGLFVIGHDAGHDSFSGIKIVDRFVGHLCMAPLANSFHTWVVTHNHHHAHTQLRGSEIDWASHLQTKEELATRNWREHFVIKMGYAMPFGIFFWILVNIARRGALIETQIGAEKYKRERSRLLFSNLLMLTCVICIYGGLYLYGGVWAMLLFYGIPATIATLTGSLIITIQHANRQTLSYTKSGWTPTRGQIVSTFDVRFWAPFEWLWCHITCHIPHHLAPSVPWYNLRMASIALQDKFPDYYQSRRFSWWHIGWFRKTPTIREVPEMGYFVIETSKPKMVTT